MVQFGFYAWAAVAFLMVFFILKNASNSQKVILRYMAFCIFWITYITIISYVGILDNFGLPPRVPLMIVIPITVGIIWLINRKSFESILVNTPIYVPILLQSFRIIVEFLIFGAYLNGVFPKRATFEGLNYDIVVGFSALLIGGLVQKNKLSFKSILIWNIISLSILSLTVYSFISSYYFMSPSMNINYDFVKFPYILLASVLLPIAIFLHAFSIKQTLLKTKS